MTWKPSYASYDMMVLQLANSGSADVSASLALLSIDVKIQNRIRIAQNLKPGCDMQLSKYRPAAGTGSSAPDGRPHQTARRQRKEVGWVGLTSKNIALPSELIIVRASYAPMLSIAISNAYVRACVILTNCAESLDVPYVPTSPARCYCPLPIQPRSMWTRKQNARNLNMSVPETRKAASPGRPWS